MQIQGTTLQPKKKNMIAFLDQGETLGGTERFLLDFINSLSQEDQKRNPSIVLGGSSRKYRERIPETIPIYSFSFPSVKGNLFTKIWRLFQIISSAQKLNKKLKTEQITTVFSNTPRTSFVMFFAKILWRTRSRWIVMIHDFSIPGKILSRIVAQCNTVVVSSTAARNYVHAHIRPKDYKKIKIVENSVDVDALPNISTPTEIKNILMLGRIDPQKGQKYALEAADLLLERNPDLQFKIVGSPFEKDERTVRYNQEIHEFVKERELSNVSFQEEVSNPFEVIAQCDCLLALPTQPESFGRIVIEALAMGKLVIVFRETGPKEIMQSYEQFIGVSVKPLVIEKNAMTLAETIGHFADHPDDSHIYTEKAREFVRKQFSAQESKKRLLHILTHSD